MSLPVKDFSGVGLFTAYSLKPSDSESGPTVYCLLSTVNAFAGGKSS